MFDLKNFSYEQNDFRHKLSKDKRYFKHIRPSSLFLINNDPLYLYKKNYVYHYNILNHNYKIDHFTIEFLKIKKIIFIYAIFYIYLLIFIKKIQKKYTNKPKNNIIIHLFYFYKNNYLNINNYKKMFI
jgi:hypothetical protein